MEDSKTKVINRDYFPSFSVSVCVYGKDNAEHFKTAIESVLKQSAPPDEIVLVVDGPVPETLCRIIREFEKLACFRAVWLEQNQGHGNARRIGITNCKYPLIALMDADDICRPDRFEQQLKAFLENPNLDIIGGNISEFCDDPRESTGSRVVPQRDDEIKQYMKRRCPMNQVTVMFWKAAVEKAGGYIDWFCEEDYYLWIRMAQQGAVFANVDSVLVDVRMDKSAISRRGGMKYFQSEKNLQRYMYQHGIIGLPRYVINVLERFLVQIMLPPAVRLVFYRLFARKK